MTTSFPSLTRYVYPVPECRVDYISRIMESNWIFNTSLLHRLPSLSLGMPMTEEIRRRQRGSSLIHRTADRLNHDSRIKINQVCICCAMSAYHRFFAINAFQHFEPLDVAAVCIFHAGKTEECPRRLEYLTRIWLQDKLGTTNLPRKLVQYKMHYLTQMENLLLKTLGFGLTFDLPHPYIISYFPDLSGGAHIPAIAYYFASDVMHMTNWPIRYRARTIACVCIHMACLWARTEDTVMSQNWFKEIDPELEESQLLELTEEFSNIYKKHENKLNIKKFALLKMNGLRSSSEQAGPSKYGSANILPPPPIAPQLPASLASVSNGPLRNSEPTSSKKIDFKDYKQRSGHTSFNQEGNKAPRPNFMPTDLATAKADANLDLPPLPLVQLSEGSKPVISNSLPRAEKIVEVENIKMGSGVNRHELRQNRPRDCLVDAASVVRPSKTQHGQLHSQHDSRGNETENIRQRITNDDIKRLDGSQKVAVVHETNRLNKSIRQQNEEHDQGKYKRQEVSRVEGGPQFSQVRKRTYDESNHRNEQKQPTSNRQMISSGQCSSGPTSLLTANYDHIARETEAKRMKYGSDRQGSSYSSSVQSSVRTQSTAQVPHRGSYNDPNNTNRVGNSWSTDHKYRQATTISNRSRPREAVPLVNEGPLTHSSRNSSVGHPHQQYAKKIQQLSNNLYGKDTESRMNDDRHDREIRRSEYRQNSPSRRRWLPPSQCEASDHPHRFREQNNSRNALTTLPPPPLPPKDDELEDGELP